MPPPISEDSFSLTLSDCFVTEKMVEEEEEEGFENSPLLNNYREPAASRRKNSCSSSSTRAVCLSIVVLTIIILGLVIEGSSVFLRLREDKYEQNETSMVVESENGVVAADDARCSEIGVVKLREGGHAVDAAVATALCLGVVNPMSSGIGGGGFMIVKSSSSSQAQAFDLRESAPLAASEDMYAKNMRAKSVGALSMGVPGEIAGLYESWLRYGKLAWKNLFQPAIRLAYDGFTVAPYLASAVKKGENKIMADTGLREIFAPNGKLLETGDTCYNVELAHTLEAVAEQGPKAFYNGSVGEKFVRDVKEVGGILTMEDMRSYSVKVMEAMAVDVMGYKILGMPPPSSGTLGLSLVLNILDSYGSLDSAKGTPLGLHRLIEALKHMFAIRMNLGDPDFVNITEFMSDMLSPSYATQIRRMIFDNTTFPPEYYMSKWSQLNDHGTSHFCIVDADRNAVSMTTTVNSNFGAGVLSPSTGIVLNNEMDDFSAPTEETEDKLPPAPANFIRPNKRPLSSMTPIIILKDNQLAGVIGGSGGLHIIPAVVQVFLNHFVMGMEPLAAVQHPRIYHKLIPNVVFYENWTVIDGDHIEVSDERKAFLMGRGHKLMAKAGGAICQLVVQTTPAEIQNMHKIIMGRKSIGANSDDYAHQVFHGMLTAVSDPRKDGRPAAV